MDTETKDIFWGETSKNKNKEGVNEDDKIINQTKSILLGGNNGNLIWYMYILEKCLSEISKKLYPRNDAILKHKCHLNDIPGHITGHLPCRIV